jgi:Carboxypeptidase regulatory-like domain
VIGSTRRVVVLAIAIATASSLETGASVLAQHRIGPGSVVGRVVSAEDPSQAIPGATVTVISIDGRLLGGALTEASGAFAVRGLPTGPVRIKVAKTAYLAVEHGARGPGRRGMTVVLDLERPTELTLRLPRGAVIAGTVYDATGNPFPGMPVQVLRRRGSQLIAVANDLDSRARMTDAEGRYRLYGLDAGEYLVGVTSGIMGAGVEGRAVTEDEVRWAKQRAAGGAFGVAVSDADSPAWPQGSGRLVYESAYHPSSATAADAASIALSQGEVRTGVDVRMRLVPASRLAGRTVGPDGRPIAAGITLFPDRSYVPDADQGISAPGDASSRGGVVALRTDAAGTFAIATLTPGPYRIAAQADTDDGSGPLWALTSVRMSDADRTDMVVTLEPGGSISGRIDRASDSIPLPPEALTALHIDLVAEDESVGAATLRGVRIDAGTAAFEVASIAPGRYRLQVKGVPEGWFAAQAVAGATDALDSPLEIASTDHLNVKVRLSPTPASISGRFADTTGRAASEYYVIVFPDDASAWRPRARRIRVTRPDDAGRFEIPGLPSGTYRLAATWDVEPDEWFDTAFLDALVPASIPVALADGEHRVQNVQVAGTTGTATARRR